MENQEKVTVITIKPEHAKGANFVDPFNCALARAMREAGVSRPNVSCARVKFAGRDVVLSPPFFQSDFVRVRRGATVQYVWDHSTDIMTRVLE